MATDLDRARRFLALPRIAAVGVSRNPKDFTRALLRALSGPGREVVPVNPASPEIDGRRAPPRLAGVEPRPDGVLVLVPSAQAEAVVREAVALGIRHVWLHRGAGAGASSPAARAACEEAGVELVDGLCPFMALDGAGWFHRVHGFFRLRSLGRAGRARGDG